MARHHDRPIPAAPRGRARNRGLSTLPVVLLLALLAGGAYNYQRNWQAEARIPRPYETYSVADLEALRAAYQAENAAVERQYESARGGAGEPRRAGMLDENIAAFEAAQRHSTASRSLGVKLSLQQTATGEIEAELERRKEEANPLQIHLKRLLTL